MGSHFGMRQNYQEEARNIIISLINDGYKNSIAELMVILTFK